MKKIIAGLLVSVGVFALMLSVVPVQYAAAVSCQGSDKPAAGGGPCVTPGDPRYPSGSGSGSNNKSGGSSRSSCTSDRSCDPSYQKEKAGPPTPTLGQKAKDYLKQVADAQKKRGTGTSTGSTKKAASDDNGGKSAPTQTVNTSYPGTTVAGPKPAYPAPPAGVKKVEPKKGNVLVITYLDQERVDSKGNRDKRLGLVNVKVEKVDGSAKCSNRKGTTAKTNGVRTIKKDGEDILVKGTANWRNCNEGKYKVTAVGRDGYTVKGDTTKEVTVTDDNTEVIKFVLTKNKTEKKKKSNTKKTSDANIVGTRRFV